jgi:hypothetical protein
MKHVGLVGVLITALFLLNAAHATVWYVHPDSTLNAIQVAIDMCSTGDTVLVGAGTYIENINFNGMAITVTSEYGRDTTIIDGGSPGNPDSGSVVSFVSGEDTTSVLSGFTITDGSGTNVPPNGWAGGGIFCQNSSPTITGNSITGDTANYGGGIMCYLSSSPIITENIITSNGASPGGGGVEVYDNSFAVISDNVITGNVGYEGGGVRSTNSSPIISDNTIADNTAYTYGGGITMNGSGAAITDNIITGNTSNADGGGIECWQCSITLLISRNIITDNTAGNGGGIRCYMSAPVIDSCTIAHNNLDGILCVLGSMPSIHHCNIYGHIGNGVWNTYPSVNVDAENCWWGDPSGPYHPDSNPGGLGNWVGDHVDFIPWLTDSVQGIGIKEIVVSQPSLLNLQVSPNPFRRYTDIRYQVADNRQECELKIYDTSGRLITDFSEEISGIGYRSSVKWDGTDRLNRKLGSGVYFLKLTAGNSSTTKKLLLIR